MLRGGSGAGHNLKNKRRFAMAKTGKVAQIADAKKTKKQKAKPKKKK